MKMARFNRKAALLVLSVVAMVFTAACGGSNPPAPTPVSTPTPVAQSVITMTCNPYTLTDSPTAGFRWRIAFPCQIRESAGLAASLNYARASFFLGGVEVERAEIGANDIIAAAGTNRIAANGTVSGTFAFDFNRGDATSGILEFNFTDDRRNTGSVTFPFH